MLAPIPFDAIERAVVRNAARFVLEAATLSHRRNFLRGLVAAPAIVAIGNIMPVRALSPAPEGLWSFVAKPKLAYVTDYKALLWFNGTNWVTLDEHPQPAWLGAMGTIASPDSQTS